MEFLLGHVDPDARPNSARPLREHRTLFARVQSLQDLQKAGFMFVIQHMGDMCTCGGGL